MIKQVIWTSMVDYPNHVSTILFFNGCNFDCQYCYNKELMKMDTIDFDNDILPKLIERKDMISHIVLSGGECTNSSEFTQIVQKLYLSGFTVGIQTNGSNPSVVENNIEEISFLGIDVKTSFSKYNDICNTDVDIDSIVRTIRLAIDNGKEYQVRTTMFPLYVTMEDCIKIADFLKDMGVEQYTIQQYYPVGSATIQEQYTPDELKNIQQECNKIIHTNLKIK